jgi:succinate dehydrogenase flavin-adding protein (antitoxin of CptAB toxin-antitoxin module)
VGIGAREMKTLFKITETYDAKFEDLDFYKWMNKNKETLTGRYTIDTLAYLNEIGFDKEIHKLEIIDCDLFQIVHNQHYVEKYARN